MKMVFYGVTVLLMFALGEVQGQQRLYPVNTLAVVGNDAGLGCRYHARSCAQVKWQKGFPNGSAAVNIADDGTVYNQNKYQLDVSSFCDLVIKNVQITDSGTYICTIAGSTRGLADLIVLHAMPSCSTSCKSNTTEGENVDFNCGLTHGAVDIRTSLSWWNNRTRLEIAGVPPEITSNSNRTVNRDFSGKALAPQVDSLICLARFYVAQTPGKASNVPEVRCQTKPCKILYSVRNAVTWPLGYASPDEKITCKAEGNPEPTYEWEWKNEAAEDHEWVTVPDETEETIDAFLNNGTSIKLRCVAKNKVNGLERTDYSAAVTVSKHGGAIRTAIIVSVIVAVVILVIVAGVIYKFCFNN